jgi:hypothetical protein
VNAPLTFGPTTVNLWEPGTPVACDDGRLVVPEGYTRGRAAGPSVEVVTPTGAAVMFGRQHVRLVLNTTGCAVLARACLRTENAQSMGPTSRRLLVAACVGTDRFHPVPDGSAVKALRLVANEIFEGA